MKSFRFTPVNENFTPLYLTTAKRMNMQEKMIAAQQDCKQCGTAGQGNYCNKCGQSYRVKRITFSGLLHDVFHLFTHVEAGFIFTLKQLLVAPGHMQRRYIEGERSKYQKPFSMFFLCATIAGIMRYWVYSLVIKYYHTGDSSEAYFFHHYMVFLQIGLLPVYSLLCLLLFYTSRYNYSEISVLMLYTTAVFFLIASITSLVKLIWPETETAYIEIPVMAIYNLLTFINFFHGQPRVGVGIKSILLFAFSFFVAQLAEDWLVHASFMHGAAE